MVSNFTNINETNNRLAYSFIEHKKIMTYGVGNLGPGFWKYCLVVIRKHFHIWNWWHNRMQGKPTLQFINVDQVWFLYFEMRARVSQYISYQLENIERCRADLRRSGTQLGANCPIDLRLTFQSCLLQGLQFAYSFSRWR